MTKPDVVYDNQKHQFRQFGTTDGKTLLPVYVIGILMAIILYIFFYHLSIRESEKAENNANNTNNDYIIQKESIHQYQIQQQMQQIQNLQYQMNQLLQQQQMQQLYQNINNKNNIHVMSEIMPSNLPNSLNV
jgi:Tfp pilus assembly protein PilN